MKNNDKCVKRGCPGVFICDGEFDDFECGHFHIALESKLQSTPSTNKQSDAIPLWRIRDILQGHLDCNTVDIIMDVME